MSGKQLHSDERKSFCINASKLGSIAVDGTVRLSKRQQNRHDTSNTEFSERGRRHGQALEMAEGVLVRVDPSGPCALKDSREP